VRALADSGALGEITRFESRFERRQDGPPAAGGGTLLDFGSHLVDQAIQLLGPVRTVYAEIHHRDDPAGLDDDVFVALAHARGAHSHLWGSWVQSAPGPRFRVTGTRATYVVDGLDIQEELLVAGRTPASEARSWGTEPQDRWGRLHDGSETASLPTERGRWDTYSTAHAPRQEPEP
jgi:predicted dehydrogenase